MRASKSCDKAMYDDVSKYQKQGEMAVSMHIREVQDECQFLLLNKLLELRSYCVKSSLFVSLFSLQLFMFLSLTSTIPSALLDSFIGQSAILSK